MIISRNLNWQIIYPYFRVIWLILVISAICICILYTTVIYEKWICNTTVFIIEKVDFGMKNIPFPAVTICSNNKIMESQVEKVLLSQPWKNLSEVNSNFVDDFKNALSDLAVPEKLETLNNESKNIINDYKANLTNILNKVSKQVHIHGSDILISDKFF